MLPHLTRKEYEVNGKIYELDTVSDLEAWSNTHVIASHRRPPEYSFRKCLAICLAISAMAVTLTSAAVPPSKPFPTPHALAVVAPEAVLPAQVPEVNLPIIDDRAALRAGREQARRDTPPTPKPQPPKPAASKVEIAIAYALAQQGDRYRWGASGPDAFDCSGLVLAAFKQVGLNLPHYTGTMIGYGTKVSRANMVRGDIIFPTSGHVAIYLGNNTMVAASSGAGKVRVQTVYSFYAARRLL